MQIETRSLEHTDTATQSHWTACIAMLIVWLAKLFDQITRMKRVRRHTTTFRPDWRDNWQGLRQSEWLRDQTLAFGAAELLAGKPLTLDFDPILDPPADYGGPCPQSPFEMNRRFLALAEFLRDPEAVIRRHAQRIAKREGINLSNPLAAHGSTDALRAAHHEGGVFGSKFTLMVSSAQSARPSNHAGKQRAQARGPPACPRASGPVPDFPSPASARLRLRSPRHAQNEKAALADGLPYPG